jgi:hypothetical protein
MQKEIRRLIAENRPEEALKLLEPFAPDEVILLQGRLAGLNRQNLKGLLSAQEYRLEYHRIIHAAIELTHLVPIDSTPPATNPPPPSPSQMASFPVYFSYAWNDAEKEENNREDMVNRLFGALEADGFNLKRDKMNIQYKGFISDFMREIGRGGLIVVALSDKYLRSPYCMHELNEIYRNSRQERDEFAKKIFPIRVEDIKINDPRDIDVYLSFWDAELSKWKVLVEQRPDQLGRALFDEYQKIKEIHSNFGDLVAYLRNMNTLTAKLLAEDDFAIVRTALRIRIDELSTP